MFEQQFVVIGIDDNQEQRFTPEQKAILATNVVFSGGHRHYEIVAKYLPRPHTWIPVTIPLDNVFERYATHRKVVVFASGDPLFYGFAQTIRKRVPEASITVYPYFNSLQLLAHRLFLPYQDMLVVSLTGRPWDKLDEALISGFPVIGILTDRVHTPAAIAERMITYGYTNYTLAIGESLGNKEKERVSVYTPEEAAERTFSFPNNVILQRTVVRPRPFGIPEQEFHLLNGRSKMITKMPIRLLSLSMLDLRNKKVLWDIGFCTGSVSIEAKLQFPHLKVIAFEKRPEGAALIEANMQKMGTPGIVPVIGDFMQAELEELPQPDAIFIGGHGGRMNEIIQRIYPLLSNSGCIVFNSVSKESYTLFAEAIKPFQLTLEDPIRIGVDNHNIIEVMKAVKL